MRRVDEWVAIRENAKINHDLYKFSFRSKTLGRLLQPGQFLQIGLTPNCDPFLRRPFTIYRIDGDSIEILYEIVGRGTGMLAGMAKGAMLRVMGPLGNTFRLHPGRRVRVAVGGGVGIAPFVFLGETIRIDHFLMGALTRGGLLPRSELGSLWKRARFSTDDGSYGKKGFVTECLEEVIREEKDPRNLYLYICGPRPMMKAVTELAARYGIEGEASVDERMACGVGACLGCVVSTTEGFKTACRDGTVFPFDKLLL